MPELSVLNWSQGQTDAFIRMQFDAQTRHYTTFYPHATYSVIVVGGESAGRLIVDRSDDQILIIDLALLPEFRGHGIGGGLVRCLLEEADDRGLPVRCHVVEGGDAREFWERAGFEAGRLDGAHLAMERRCATSPR